MREALLKRSRLMTAVCVALLGVGVGACDEGGGTDAGVDGATTGTDSGGPRTDGGDPGPCPAGAFDLGALANADGFTLVDAGSVDLNVSGTLFGNPSMHTDTIYVCVPDDIVSFAVLVDSSSAAGEGTPRQVFPTS